MSRVQVPVWIVLAALSAPAIAAAQTVRQPEPAGDSRRIGAAEDSGVYPGVVPGARHAPPRARRLAKTRHTFVTWPGFEMTGSGSRFFVQTTRPITWRRADEPNRIVLVFEKTRIHLRNNRNPLVTDHFNTPVSRAFLRRQRRDTLLVLEMKVGSEPRIHQSVEGEYHFLFIEFPEGTYPVPSGTTPTAVPDETRRRGGEEERMTVRPAD